MEPKAGARIGRKAFLQSVVILLFLMMVYGSLTRLLPPGQYDRIAVDGRQIIDPGYFCALNLPDYPIWRWFVALLEVLFTPEGILVIVIILFLLMVGGTFAVLDQSGIMREGIRRIVEKFGEKKYLLLRVITFAFMCLGAFLGIFEEVVPLVPIMLGLSYHLG